MSDCGFAAGAACVLPGHVCPDTTGARSLSGRASVTDAVLTGFEPAASTLTGWRALQTAPQDQVSRRLPCVALREETVQEGEAPGRTHPLYGVDYGTAASIAFTIRLSETGYAVPSAWAK
ncbi:hypothetical protein EASAB2608_03587 [Streptomyces sp. EAS-AB2608]|nr:hypothetical protein EASAB2608_03587 [Streptomyces sp. EAS-AB2608]